MDGSLGTTSALLVAALVLLVVAAHTLERYRRTAAPAPRTELGPWYEGGFYRLTAEEQRTVRRAVRHGTACSDPRLAEAAWRRAEIIQHNRGYNWAGGWRL